MPLVLPENTWTRSTFGPITSTDSGPLEAWALVTKAPLAGLFSQPSHPFTETWRQMGGDGGPANLLGWPTVAFPIGFEEGSPIGGQVISPAFRENVSIAVARAYQEVMTYHEKRPQT